jgi:aryl-phospho-beta-D-glucosidase BglC (GH1 family)
LEGRTVPSVTAQFTNVNDWGAGFQGEIRIDNGDSTPVNNWQLEFDFARSIDYIWCASIASHVGNHYVINHLDWNSTVFPNSSVIWGFLGSPGGVTQGPTNFKINGVPVGGGSAGSLPTMNIGNTSVTEGDVADVSMRFPVTLSAASASTVTVHYATATGSAGGADYSSRSGTLTFQPGETSKTIDVPVTGDFLDESDENFSVILSSASGANLGAAQGKGTIVDNDPPPTAFVSDASVQEPAAGSGTAPGYFHTGGNQIVDSSGQSVRISGVSWFGFESNTFCPHGLWARGYKSMMDQMKQLGFNTIRLPFSDQLFDSASKPNSIDFAKNPDLQNLNGVQILDKIVTYASQIGLRIILDHHRSEAGAGTEANGLWYTSQYPESRWIADWTMLATRYANNPTVLGADVHNEPHTAANWGGGGANDWRLAAERAGNAILSVNPNWLIIVEGVDYGPSGYYWWGGNLSAAGQYPVRLNTAGRLVYSPHDYPASVYNQPWFSAANYPQNMYGIWDQNWGYLFRQGTAPILLGEFGSQLATNSDQVWMDTMVNYLKGDLDGNGSNDLPAGSQGVSWTWWAWNPNSGDTGGILKDDWNSVNQNKVDKLKPVEFSWGSAGGTATLTFTVSLSTASGKPVTVNYQAVDQSAQAGSDYQAASGSITFAPGETSKTVSVTVLSDNLVEGTETFLLHLSSPTNAILGPSDGIGTILDR